MAKRSKGSRRSSSSRAGANGKVSNSGAASSSEAAARAIWSGTISFGLVTVPVHLFSAIRSRPVGLRMLDEDGTPLARRWLCPKDETWLEDDDIVRGYEVDDDKYVVVTDEELEALEPRKSRDIDLRRFVPREAVDARYFEHGYLLAPASDSTKAYRLLAAVMEETDRAGIATFVMRDREYLVAILAENGVLSAETLRFADELRPPEAVGLSSSRKKTKAKSPGKTKKPDAVTLRRFERAIGAHVAKKLDPSVLEDETAEKLLALVERKRKSRKDVVEIPEAARDQEQGAEIIDLMEVLKRSLSGDAAQRPRRRKKTS
jgi:DNA end-binding protein Ku